MTPPSSRSPRPSPIASWLPVLLGAALFLTSFGARAQTTTSAPSVAGLNGAVLRLEPNLSTSADLPTGNPHPAGVLANEIDLEDCDANLAYEFSLSISNLAYASTYPLNIWAGTADCSQLSNRQPGSDVCWPLISPTIAVQSPYSVIVRMQDIASQAFMTTRGCWSDDAAPCAPPPCDDDTRDARDPPRRRRRPPPRTAKALRGGSPRSPHGFVSMLP